MHVFTSIPLRSENPQAGHQDLEGLQGIFTLGYETIQDFP